MPLSLFGHKFGHASQPKADSKDKKLPLTPATPSSPRPVDASFDAARSRGKSVYQGDLLSFHEATPQPSLPKAQATALSAPNFSRSGTSSSRASSISTTLTPSLTNTSTRSTVSSRSSKRVSISDAPASSRLTPEERYLVGKQLDGQGQRTRSRGLHRPKGKQFPIDAPHDPETVTPSGKPSSAHLDPMGEKIRKT